MSRIAKLLLTIGFLFSYVPVGFMLSAFSFWILLNIGSVVEEASFEHRTTGFDYLLICLLGWYGLYVACKLYSGCLEDRAANLSLNVMVAGILSGLAACVAGLYTGLTTDAWVVALPVVFGFFLLWLNFKIVRKS